MLGIDTRAAKYTFTAAMVLCLLYALYVVRSAVFVLVVSIMLAYLLYPLVDLIDRYLPGRSRGVALTIVYLLLLGAVAGLAITIGSKAADEAKSLSERAPALIERLKQTDNPSTPDSIESVRQTILGSVQAYIYKHYSEYVSFIPSITIQILKASTNLLYIIIVPIISFFFLKDGRRLKDEFLDLLDPGSSRVFADSLLQDVHLLLLQYMRALFTLCTVTLVVFAITLSAMGVPDAFLLSCIAFPLEFVPLLGPLMAAITIVGVTILNGYPHLLWVIVFLAAFRLAQDYVISPRLMSAGIELHPLLVIFGVFAGGEIAGIQGTFLSVPIIAMLRVVYRRIRTSRLVHREPVVARS